MSGTVAKRSLAGRRVLVVEDEFFIADDMALALRGLGATVLGPVPTPAEAETLLRQGERPDLAVLDLNLRGEMVFPVADALRAAGVPILLATGYGQEAVPERFRDLPRWEKPFDPAALARVLPALLPDA